MADLSALAADLIGEAAPAPAPAQDQASAPVGGSVDQTASQLIAEARGEGSHTFIGGVAGALHEAYADGEWKKRIPFTGTALQADDLHQLWQAARRTELGEQSREDEALILAYLAKNEAGAKRGMGGTVGAILAELPTFFAEFGASGGAANFAKAGGKAALGKGLREALEASASKIGARVAGVKVGKLGVGKAALGAAGAMGNTALQLGAATGMGEAVGGSRITADAWRRALPEWSLSENEAGHVHLAFHTTTGEFVDQLPKAILNEYIEFLSERSGEALMAGVKGAAKRVPGAAMVAQMQSQVAEWWVARNGGSVTDFLERVAKKGGWNGPVSEYLEERLGGALRGATGVEEGGVLANAFPALEQQAAELIAFSVPTAGRAAIQETFRRDATQDMDKGLTRSFTQGEPRSFQQIDAIVEASGAQRVPADAEVSPELEAAERVAARQGLEVVRVQSEDGEPIEGFDAVLVEEGIVLVDVNAVEDPARLLTEERLHDLARKDPELHSVLESTVQAGDSAGYGAFLGSYMQTFEEVRGKELDPEKEGVEGVGQWGRAMAPLVWLSETKAGRMQLYEIVQNNRNVLEKLRDFVAGGLNGLGANVRTTQERRLAKLDAYLERTGGKATGVDMKMSGDADPGVHLAAALAEAEPTTLERIQVGVVLGEALEAMTGLDVPTERRTPTTRQLPAAERLARLAAGEPPLRLKAGPQPKLPAAPEVPRLTEGSRSESKSESKPVQDGPTRSKGDPTRSKSESKSKPGGLTKDPEEKGGHPDGLAEVYGWTYQSGLTRSNADAVQAMTDGQDLGVSAHGPWSENMKRILDTAARGGHFIFLDNGAFTHFKKGTQANWAAVRDKFEDLLDRVPWESQENIVVVLPDVVNDPDQTYELLNSVIDLTWDDILTSNARFMVNVQKPKEGEANIVAEAASLTELFDDDAFTSGKYRFGIPFNAAAWSQEDVLELMEAWEDQGGVGIHLLGAGHQTLMDLIEKARAKGLNVDNLSSDALPKGISRRKRGEGGTGADVAELQKKLAKPKAATAGSVEAMRKDLFDGRDLSKVRITTQAEQEDAEMAVVLAARDIVALGMGTGATWDLLVDLYKRQPVPKVRTSRTVLEQQFSTPIPLGYLAGVLAGVNSASKVYEPTAGHGSLLTALADLDKAVVNELDPDRRRRLEKYLGLEPSKEDAAGLLVPDVDVVVANPPFGHAGKRYTYHFGSTGAKSFETGLIDHAIVAKSLEWARADARGVFIIGSQKSLKGGAEERAKARKKAYNTGQKRIFFRELYKNWNVVLHVTLSGDLYKKQGAAWPIDLIVVDGRGESKLEVPAVEEPRTLETWHEVGSLLDTIGSPHRAGRRPGEEGGDADDVGLPRPSATEAVRDAGDGGPGAGPGAGGGAVREPGADGARGADSAVAEPGREADGARPGDERDPDSVGADEGGEGARAPADAARGVDELPPGVEPDPSALFDDLLDEAYEEDELEAKLTFKKAKIVPTRAGVKTIPIDEEATQPSPEWVEEMVQKILSDTLRFSYKSRVSPGLWEGWRERLGRAASWWREMSPSSQERAGLSTIKRHLSNVGWTKKAIEDVVKPRLPAGVTWGGMEKKDGVRLMNAMLDLDAAIRQFPERARAVAAEHGFNTESEVRAEELLASPFTMDAALARIKARWDAEKERKQEQRKVSTDKAIQEARAEAKKRTAAKKKAAPPKTDADKGLDDIADLFSVPSFDRAKYLKVSPAFKSKLEAAKVDPTDTRGIVKTIIGYFQEVHNFTKAQVSNLKQYVLQFIEDVGAGEITWGKRKPKKTERPAEDLVEDTEFQVGYEGRSNARSMGTLLPKNMQTAMQVSLDKLEQEVGMGVDAYLASEMGWEVDEVEEKLGREQVDSTALAISSLKRSRAFIIGDQTGVGKGRQVATIMEWTRRQGLLPVFVTVKKGLFKDIYRDLDDIGATGFRPYVTHRNGFPRLKLPNGSFLGIASPKVHAQAKAMALGPSPKLHPDYDSIFTTYDQMKTDKGKRVDRHYMMEALAPQSVFIMDESHEGAGTELTPAEQKQVDEGTKLPRSVWLRGVLEHSRGGVFSSATFAKDAYTMALYSKTDLGLAFPSPDELEVALVSGGDAIMQVVSNDLTASGQLVRRERSFEGVEMTDEAVPVTEERLDEVSQHLADFLDLDVNLMAAARKDFTADVLPGLDLEAFPDAGVGMTAAQDMGFGSQIYEIGRKTMLALKAKATADAAIAEWKQGRKPVVTFEITMESTLRDLVKADELSEGSVLPNDDFRVVMRNALNRLRRITLKDPDNPRGPAIGHHIITDAQFQQIGHGGALEKWNAMLKSVEDMDVSELTLSPIDTMVERMEEAGMRVGELTGRSMKLRSVKGRKVLATRQSGAGLNNQAIEDFNSGELDALLFNVTGATGFSMHASEKVKDQRQRVMLMPEVSSNIVIHKQMMGRIHRTGQVIEPTDYARRFENEKYGLPMFRILFADVPYESRQKAVIQKKMASLNATTTSATESADRMESGVDYLNKYGDRVVVDVLQDLDLRTVARLGMEKFLGEDAPVQDAAKKFSGRALVLSVRQQEEVMRLIEDAYAEYIKYLDAIGANDLVAPLLELDAKRVALKEVKGSDGPSRFQRAIYEERVDVKKLYPPIPVEGMLEKVVPVEREAILAGIRESLPRELGVLEEEINRVTENVGPLTEARDAAFDALQREEGAYAAARAATAEKLKKPDSLKKAEGAARRTQKELDRGKNRVELTRAQMAKLNNQANALEQTLERFKPGNPIMLTTAKVNASGEEGERKITFGIVVKLERRGKTKSALSPSDYAVTIYTAAGTAPVSIRLSQVFSGKVQASTSTMATVEKVVNAERANARQQVSIMSGNTLRAWGEFSTAGQIIIFRDHGGRVREGVMLQDGMTAIEVLRNRPLLMSPAQIEVLADKEGQFGVGVWGPDGLPRVQMQVGNGNVAFRMASAGSFKAVLAELRRRDYPELEQRSVEGKKFWVFPAEVHLTPQQASTIALVVTQEMGKRYTWSVAEGSNGQESKDAVRDALGLPKPKVKDVDIDTADFSVPRSRRHKAVPLRFDTGPEGFWDHKRRLLQDKDLRFKRFEERLRSVGGVVGWQNSVYRSMERHPGKVEKDLRRWSKHFYDKIVEVAGEAGLTPKIIDLFLYVRHAPERNDYIRKKNIAEWKKQATKKLRQDSKNSATTAQRQLDRAAEDYEVALAKLSNYEEGTKSYDQAVRRLQKRKDDMRELKVNITEQLRIAAKPEDYLVLPPEPIPFTDVEQDPGSGMETSVAEALLKDMRAGEQGEALDKIGALVDAMNQDTRAQQLAHGLISRATYDTWEARYDHYVPLRTAVEPSRERTGKRFDTRGPVTKEAWGRKQLAHSPLTFSIQQGRGAIVYGHKNQVGVSLLRLIKKNRKLVTGQFEVREEPEIHEAEDGEQLPTETQPQDNEFGLRSNGRAVYVRVTDPLLLRSLQGLGDKHAGPVVDVLSRLNRFLSMMNTSLDVGFLLTNFTRDLQTASINLAGEESTKLARQVFRSTINGTAVRAALRGFGERKGTTPAQEEWDDAFAALEDAGGLTGWFYQRDFAQQSADLSRDLADVNPTTGRAAWLKVRKMGTLIENYNRAFENGVRLAAFKHGREAGMSEEQAASLAKNLTVNFNRRGEWGQVANSLYLFYNASVQGTARMLLSTRSPGVRKLLVGIASAAFALEFLNAAMSDDDEDGVPFYDKIPDYIKERNLIWMLPGTGGGYVKIPLPYGYSLFHTIGQQGAAVARGAATTGQAFSRTGAAALDSFSPLGSRNPFESATAFAEMALPTVADPIIQLAGNETFYGAPIRPSAFGSPEPPRSQLYWSSTSETAKAAASAINRITGGDEYTPGGVDWAPDQIEHIAEFAFGGVGRQLSRGWRLGEAAAMGEGAKQIATERTYDIPIVRRFVGIPDNRYDRERYYETREEIQRATKALKDARASRDSRAVQEVRDRYQDSLKLEPALKRTEARLRQLRRLKRGTEDQKAVERIDKEIERLQSRFTGLARR